MPLMPHHNHLCLTEGGLEIIISKLNRIKSAIELCVYAFPNFYRTAIINNKSLQRLVKGEQINGIDATEAMKLYLALQTLGFSKSFLNKRYMIDAINDLKKSGEEEKTFLKLSKITSISQIERANYADGDVIAQIKSIINADYDTWRIENVIGVEEEIEAAKKNPLLETVSREDIETYLATSSKVKEEVKPFNKAA